MNGHWKQDGKPLKRLMSIFRFNTGLKVGVNEK